MTTTRLGADGVGSRERTAAQQPDWQAPDAVARVRAELGARHPLVDAAACHALRDELRAVARGQAFVIQGGDCAEPFADATGDRIQAKAALLEDLADLFETHTGLPVVRVGRFAGQYAKPRSSPVETLPDGAVVPAFRGEAVNGFDLAEREPDVRRLLVAYDHAAAGLDALFLNRFLPLASDGPFVQTYASHEALLLDFEEPLVRPDWYAGGHYASSAHFLWIGDRTRQLDGAHVHFAQTITNPVGLKVGPTMTAPEITALVTSLAGGEGKLTLIARMGAEQVVPKLTELIIALGPLAESVVWMCDPMHGNTRKTATGQKTRLLDDVLTEVGGFVSTLREHGLRPGGLHLEMTPEPVAECLVRPGDLARTEPLAPYTSLCDPRLNRDQAEDVVRYAAELISLGGNRR